MFWVGIAIGIGLGAVASSLSFLMLFFSKRSLNNEMSSPIIRDRLLRPKALQKRAPKALTDLMAYNREIQEQGENRG